MRGIRVLHRLNEEHANVVRRIFELRAEGEGFAAIAKRPDQQLARKKALTAEQESFSENSHASPTPLPPAAALIRS